MKHRFRYLDERGQQVEVDDLASLREHVRSGKVDDQTLLYDALTDEWAPAEKHPAFRLIEDPLAVDPRGAAAGETARISDGTRRTADADDEPDFPDLDITLAPARELESTEEVVEKLLREREKDRQQDIASPVETTLGGTAETDPPVEAEPPPPALELPTRGPSLPSPGDEPIRVRRRPTPRRHPSRRVTGRTASRRTSVPRGWIALGVALIIGIAYYGLSKVRDSATTAEAATDSSGPSGQVRTSANPAWAAVEGGALGDMFEGVDSLRRVHGVERIPTVWLAGPYLADAPSYPEVRDYWTSYLEFVEAVRLQDTVLFRRSFVNRLEDEELSGPIVSIRLARALETFRESQPARDTVYERMEDLAEASLDLHNVLVERAADIDYDPVTEERASRQPILEAWSDDPYLRQTIWSLLDRITANLALLENDTGSGRSDLTERLFQELRNRSTMPRDGGGG